MPFEYDPTKSKVNKAKHGIDFEEAQALWNDEDHVVLASRYPAEERHLVIGAAAGKLWAAIVTSRAGNIRIISVRRARQDETEAYFSRRAR
jgi:uncharacterized protein